MSKTLVVDEDDLYEVYKLLADATEAASTGDPNTVSKKAAEAKRKVMSIHKDSEVKQ